MTVMLTVVAIAFAKGCLPCVVPYQATAPCSHRHSWSKRKRLLDKGPFRTSYGNGRPWSCSCITNRWCPMAKWRNGSSYICVPCNGGVGGGRRATFRWQTSPDEAARRIFPPLDHALVKAVACELVAETKQPLSRQSLADVTARARNALGTPISRSTVWRISRTVS